MNSMNIFQTKSDGCETMSAEEDRFDNRYALLLDNTPVEKATEAIDKAIKEFAKRIKTISKKYPTVGIGDTATDEEIVGEVYNAIHS